MFSGENMTSCDSSVNYYKNYLDKQVKSGLPEYKKYIKEKGL